MIADAADPGLRVRRWRFRGPCEELLGLLDQTLGALDLDLAGAGGDRLGDGHGEDAALDLRLDRIDVRALGQCERTREAAVAALDAPITAARLFALVFTLAAQDQHVVLDLDVDVFGGYPRQLCFDQIGVVLLHDVHGGIEARRFSGGAGQRSKTPGLEGLEASVTTKLVA